MSDMTYNKYNIALNILEPFSVISKNISADSKARACLLSNFCFTEKTFSKKMKISLSLLSFSAGSNFQGHRFLAGEKLTTRSNSCREKVDEAKANWNVENGEWICPLYNSNNLKITCFPKCPDSSFKRSWQHLPYRKRPKIIATCGDPPTYRLK